MEAHETGESETMKGKAQKDRTHCPRGHAYTPENTKRLPIRKDGIPTGRFKRQCVQCKKEWRPSARGELSR